MTSVFCERCKKRRAGKEKEISFYFRGIIVKIPKDRLLCAKCAEESWIEVFEENAKGIVEIVGKKIVVNWKLYLEKGGKQKELLNCILIGLEIFSLTAKGNWEIVAEEGTCLNPRLLSVGVPLYFTKEKDAKEYARLRFSHFWFQWELRQVSKVIPKHKVLK